MTESSRGINYKTTHVCGEQEEEDALNQDLVPIFVTLSSQVAVIRYCSKCDEHLSPQLAGCFHLRTRAVGAVASASRVVSVGTLSADTAWHSSTCNDSTNIADHKYPWVVLVHC